MTKYIQALTADLNYAMLVDGRVIKVFGVYNAKFQRTIDIRTATLVVVGPYTDSEGKENQYVNADLTGTMSLHNH